MNKISTQLEVHSPRIAKPRTENKAWIGLTTGAVLAMIPAMAGRIIWPVGFNQNKKYPFFQANATTFESKWSQLGLSVAARKNKRQVSTLVMRRTTSSRRRSLPRSGSRGRERRSQRTHAAMHAQCAATRLVPTVLGLVSSPTPTLPFSLPRHLRRRHQR
jgi:hypothetical protein